MRKTFGRIAATTLLTLAGTASAAIATTGGAAADAFLENPRTRLVQEGHYLGADKVRADASRERSATTNADTCIAPEPSKLGLLRSNSGTASKTRTLCRKLRA